MTRDARERAYALQLLVLVLLVSALMLLVTAQFTTPPAPPSRAPVSRALPTCVAHVAEHWRDTVTYVVKRARSAPCRVTLPMDARR